MEFSEAIRIANRMCKEFTSCKDCPAYQKCIRTLSFKFDDKSVREYEALLGKWNYENPVFTNLDKIR